MYRLSALILILFILSAAIAGMAMRDYQAFQTRPLIDAGEVNLWLPAGTSYAGLVRELERLGLTRSDWRWRLLGRLQSSAIRAGEYRLEPGLTADGLLDRLVRGNVRRHRLTIIEGWTTTRLREELARDSRLVQHARGHDDESLMSLLECPGCPAEGRFLPETYFFVRGDSDLEILARAHLALKATLAVAWEDRAQDLPLSGPDQLLVLASIIERETGRAEERSRIAGVFVRRLQRGMRLQTDPSVMYGLDDDFDGRLRRVHLQTDHPWNTYTRHGLPPTPIALAGRASIMAAANPEPGTALYFVSRGDGSHHFSDTLAEHESAVDRYIRSRN